MEKKKTKSRKPVGKPAREKGREKKRVSHVPKEVRKLAGDLAEALVFAEISDPKALADIHTQMEEIGAWAKGAGQKAAADATGAAAKLLEKIILDEVLDVEGSIETVGKTVSALQAIILDGRKADEVEFPHELWAESSESLKGEGELHLTLPPNVDETIFADFLAQQVGVMEEIEELILDLENSTDEDKLNALRRRIHTLKGEAALLSLYDVEKLCHSTEDLISTVEPGAAVDVLLSVKDWLSRIFTAYAGKGPKPGPVNRVLKKVSAAMPPKEKATPAQAAEQKELVPDAVPSSFESDPELLSDFVTEAREHLHTSDVHLLTLETDPFSEEALNAVFRAFHTIKGVAGFLALDDICSLAHEAENLLDRARKGDVTLAGEAIDATFDAVDVLKRMVNHLGEALKTGQPPEREIDLDQLLARIRSIASGETPVGQPGDFSDIPDPKLGDILIETGKTTREMIEAALAKQRAPLTKKRLGEILVEFAATSSKKLEEALSEQETEEEKRRIGDILVDMGAATREDIEHAIKLQEKPPSQPRLGEILVREGIASAKDVAHALRSQASMPMRAIEVKDTLKVDAERLDRLVDAIGELVIAESMVSQSRELKLAASPMLAGQIAQLDKITRELQEMGMSLRMVPVRSTFQKMARLVRDLSRKSNKPIEFSMAGEDTELDKTVVEKMADPLVHMIRNAIDHGIEAAPEEREAAGKPRIGKIYLRAYHKGGSIYIEVEDDGRGLDHEVILSKGIEKGLAKEGEQLTEREIFALIMQPGFSTAKKVTDVSGRGVGMDVVKKNIDSLRGQVEIKSEKGRGCLFTLRLPLTLAIIDGMVLRLGAERFVIPTLSVVRSVKPQRQDIRTVLNKGEMIDVQGHLIPLFRLARLFKIPGAVQDPIKGLVIVVEDDGRQTGLLTDELMGQQQIVIKSLGSMMSNITGISGGAIMPDGTVGLILDVGGIVKLANTAEGTMYDDLGPDSEQQEAEEAGDSPGKGTKPKKKRKAVEKKDKEEEKAGKENPEQNERRPPEAQKQEKRE